MNLRVTSALDELFEPMNRSDSPGLVVGVAHRGETIYMRGFGLANLEHRIHNSPRTRMRIGSSSKHFTCLAVMLLAEEGRLDIDTGVRTYLPELPTLEGEPTLRMLMSHTGGYRDYLNVSAITCGGASLMPRSAGFEIIKGQRASNFAPGSRMIYCNSGHHLLSLIIERTVGLPFEQFMAARIFRPAGMRDTVSHGSDLAILPDAATLHVHQADGTFRRGIFPVDGFLGEGAMVSTVGDMLRWLAHLRDPVVVGSAAIWQAMFEPAILTTGSSTHYSLGLIHSPYRGVSTIHHNGAVVGGNSQMLTVPEHELDIAVMVNRSDVSASALTERIVDVVLAEHLTVTDPPIADDGDSLLGRYYNAETHEYYSVSDVDGIKMLLPYGEGPGLRMVRHGKDFKIADSYTATIGVRALGTALEIVDSGNSSLLRRLPDLAPDMLATASGLPGTYHNVDCDAKAVVHFDGSVLSVRIFGQYGIARYDVEPLTNCLLLLTPVVWERRSHRLTASLERNQATVKRFWLNTYRTRNLEFVRT